jgi:RsiW-degrading membrane proteinase PrsW (M82 family)
MQATNQNANRTGLPAKSSSQPDLWLSLWVVLAGLLAFVILCNFVAPNLGSQLTTSGRIALGLLISVIPALLWMLCFISLDRYRPEPKRLLFGVLVGCAILAAALRTPLLEGLFRINEWLHISWWTAVIGGILVIGVLDMAFVYLSVRFLVFFTPEFDERVDGVIYAMAAGLGLSTIVNFTYILEHGGVDADVGSLHIVVNSLALAAAAGVFGYFIGQARFNRVSWAFLPAGLLTAATLEGMTFAALDAGATTLSQAQPWMDLLLVTTVALLSFAAMYLLMRREQQKSRRTQTGMSHRPRRFSLPVLTPRATNAPLAASARRGEPVEELDSPNPAEPTDESTDSQTEALG